MVQLFEKVVVLGCPNFLSFVCDFSAPFVFIRKDVRRGRVLSLIICLENVKRGPVLMICINMNLSVFVRKYFSDMYFLILGYVFQSSLV
jgi:predicted transcriptional regulator YheO